MKAAYYKTLLAAVIVASVAVVLLVLSKSVFTSNSVQNDPEKEYIVEKIEHFQEDGKDMRSEVYLTHHKYFLERLAETSVNFQQKVYTLNDICYKPHTAIFENFPNPPYFLKRMHSEMRRLSPCLIVSPLNCFYENHLIHSAISRWEDTVQVNRNLRNAYIELIDGKRTDVYVNGNNGSEIVGKWAEHFRALPAANFSTEGFEAVKKWVLSLEPRESKCADPVRCSNPLDATNYLDMCTVMQQFNDYSDRRNQRLKFEFDSGEETITTRLDCVEDKEKFIEWLQERDLKAMLKTLANVSFPDHMIIGSRRCDGIFHDVDTQPIEFFDGIRSFGNKSTNYDSIRAEIVLMTPKMLLETVQKTESLNGFAPILTVEWAEKLIEEFRVAIREEVDKFNEHLASQKIRVQTRALETLDEKTVDREMDHDIYGFLVMHFILTLLFSAFVWSGNVYQSAAMFLIRAFLAVYSFTALFDGRMVFEERILYSTVISTIANLYATTRNSFCQHRLTRCLQRKKALFTSKSNFSSLATVDSERKSTRQLCYLVAKYTKYQAAQDAYGEERIDRFPPLWWFISMLILPVIGLYWYFVDRKLVEIAFGLAIVFFVAFVEEFLIKQRFVEERKKLREEIKKVKQEVEPTKDEGQTWVQFLRKLIRGNNEESLGSLSSSTYDISTIRACPNVVSRGFRLYAVKFYFWILKLETPYSFIWNVPSILLISAAIGLLFVPISRTSPQLLTIKNDDIYIDFYIGNLSTHQMEVFERFGREIDSIGTLYTISDWFKNFERFERRTGRRENNDSFVDWTRTEPISRAITAPLAPDHFRLRYQFLSECDEQEMVRTVELIASIIEHFSSNTSSIAAHGVFYEHSLRNSVAWNRFAVNELFAAALFIGLFLLLTVLFSTFPGFAVTILFSILVVGTRLEVAAVISVFSLDHQAFYTDFAVLVGFLSAWTPFCELSRFRARILYAKKTRRTPEVATRRRIRVPFIAAVDIFHYFALLLPVQSLFLCATVLVSELNALSTPCFVLIVTQLLAVLNSIAVSVTARQMFEREVRQSLRRDLRGATTSVQFFELSHKLLTPPYEQPSIELDVITPKSPEARFWAPKRAPKRPKSEEKEEDEMDEDEQPGPSRRIHFDSFDLESQINPDFKWRLPADRLLPDDPHHYILCGPPVDFRIQYPQRQPENAVVNPIEHAEELYEMDDSSDFEDNDDEEEEEEDVHSSGEPDEEVLRVEAEMRKRLEARRQRADDVPGPSRNATLSAAEEEPIPPPPRIRAQSYVTGRELPPMIERVQPRNPLTEPPIMEEYIQENDDPSLPPHPRADQYPPDWSRAMVAYAEDRFWTERVVPLPAGIQVPPRPRDYWMVRETTPPPEDFNWTPPADAPPIFIPPEAHALFEERRRAHFRENERRD